jgi:asparagine synthase (glutamine-hydrolysing)
MSGHAAKQPIVSGIPGQRRILLFNGEIYNHLKLYNSSTDTECLLPSLDRLGANFSNQLDGEYAIVIYDEKTGQTKVYVDPFQTKPIFWGNHQLPASTA